MPGAYNIIGASSRDVTVKKRSREVIDGFWLDDTATVRSYVLTDCSIFPKIVGRRGHNTNTMLLGSCSEALYIVLYSPIQRCLSFCRGVL